MQFRELKHLPIVALVAVGLALAACGGGGGSSEAPPPPTPEPTAVERATAAIAAATTAAAAQAAYDAVKDDVTAAEGETLQAAVDARIAALDRAMRMADQRTALMTAAAAVNALDLTGADADAIAAANMAIAALEAAIAGATLIDDTSMYSRAVADAKADVRMAQTGLDTQGRMAAQRTALMDASEALTTALAALTGTPTQAQIDAAESALASLNMAIEGGADLTDADKAPYGTAVARAEGRIAGAKQARMAADAAAAEAERKAAEAAAAAMAVKAAALHKGISAPGGTGAATRTANYGEGDNASDIAVTVGDLPVVNLSEDKKTTVAAHHGWQGKRYTAEIKTDNDNAGRIGKYEAVVYSNVGTPTQGKKFGRAGAHDDYEYNLTANNNTELSIDTSSTAVQERVASSRFDQSAGKKEFKLPANTVRLPIPGMYHGVSGTYYCTPNSGETCSASKAAKGFTLANGTWTFKASSNEARVMSEPDTIYASYGWWLKTAASDGALTASAFAADKGAVTDATGLDTLQGSATYMGGAAGKYALKSSTGGTNDAGHFTAKATLEADFTDNSITGTIDNFRGDDGESRDWSVELKEAALAAGGAISRAAADDTVWTIGEKAASASGEWSGSLQDNGDDNVPKVGSGTFYTEYGADGKMVGGFGVNKQ